MVLQVRKLSEQKLVLLMRQVVVAWYIYVHIASNILEERR